MSTCPQVPNLENPVIAGGEGLQASFVVLDDGDGVDGAFMLSDRAADLFPLPVGILQRPGRVDGQGSHAIRVAGETRLGGVQAQVRQRIRQAAAEHGQHPPDQRDDGPGPAGEAQHGQDAAVAQVQAGCHQEARVFDEIVQTADGLGVRGR